LVLDVGLLLLVAPDMLSLDLSLLEFSSEMALKSEEDWSTTESEENEFHPPILTEFSIKFANELAFAPI